jgi:hypothetical protein
MKIAVAAVQAGKDVLIELPLATKLEDARRSVAATSDGHSNEHERRPMDDTAARISCTSLRQGF